jgi:MoaA/NifB/PqqE/SkfB family radical SAM enzyme
VGLVTTYRCPLACAHCIVEASPMRRELVDLGEADRLLEALASYGGGCVRAVALTGGEPFLDLEHLRRLAALAARRGLLVTAVTNAFWATTPGEAERVLLALPEVKVLTFSTDVYHLRAIPLERIENAVRAAARLGRRHVVAVCTRGNGDAETASLVDRVSAFAAPSRINLARIFPAGRARSLAAGIQYEEQPEPPEAACTMAHAPVLLPDGRVVACFGPVVSLRHGHPLVLGNTRATPLGEILDAAQRNAVLHAIRIWGPGELVRRLRATPVAGRLPGRFVADSACCACHALLEDPEICEALAALGADPAFRREVAFGRVYYLGEHEMAEALGLAARPPPGSLA